jgi:vitamin K-dependent gamma-carboxylase-like protein
MSVTETKAPAVPAAGGWRERLIPALPSARVAVLRVFVYLFVVFDVFKVVNDVIPHAQASQALYRPILMREWLHLPTPNPAYAETLRVLIIVGCLVAATGRLPRISGPVVAVAFTDWVSIGMSYSKIDHDHFALIIALWVLPTVGRARFADRFRSEAAGWALLCIQIACVATYFLSALAKIRFGGWDWVTGSTFAWAVTRRGTDLGDLFLNPPWVLTLAQIGIFTMELSTILLLVLRNRYRYAFVALLMFFHLSTWLTIRIHFLPLVVCLLAFLPLERLTPARARR